MSSRNNPISYCAFLCLVIDCIQRNEAFNTLHTVKEVGYVRISAVYNPNAIQNYEVQSIALDGHEVSPIHACRPHPYTTQLHP
jgi:hypothetical protein